MLWLTIKHVTDRGPCRYGEKEVHGHGWTMPEPVFRVVMLTPDTRTCLWLNTVLQELSVRNDTVNTIQCSCINVFQISAVPVTNILLKCQVCKLSHSKRLRSVSEIRSFHYMFCRMFLLLTSAHSNAQMQVDVDRYVNCHQCTAIANYIHGP